MDATDTVLTPNERFQQVATILAVGILRLKACPESMPEPAAFGPESTPEKLSYSGQKALDMSAQQGPHVPPI